MTDIFGRNVTPAPTEVIPGVLTWWDTFNATFGTAATVEAVNQLAVVYCPGVLAP